MFTQIIIHPTIEPLLHVDTIYNGNTKMYRGQRFRIAPFTGRARLKYVEIDAKGATLYWLTPWPKVNQWLGRSMVVAWRRCKDGLPEHVAKRAWAPGSKFYFAKPQEASEFINGVEHYKMVTWPRHQVHTLTAETRQLLDTRYLWHCVELVPNNQLTINQ